MRKSRFCSREILGWSRQCPAGWNWSHTTDSRWAHHRLAPGNPAEPALLRDGLRFGHVGVGLGVIEAADRAFEAAGQHGQVDDADGQPDDTADECGVVQAHPQDAGQNSADRRHHHVVERGLEVDDLSGAEREVRDDREVDEGEGDERSEVDQRGDELEAERHRQQADHADKDDVEHRSVGLRVDVAEGLARQHAIAPHHQQHARN